MGALTDGTRDGKGREGGAECQSRGPGKEGAKVQIVPRGFEQR